MKRQFKEISPSEKVKREKRWLILGIMFWLMGISFIFIGCSSSKGLVIKEDAQTIEVC